MKKEQFTISIYTENNIGLLTRIATIFLKRHINIESINASPTEIDNVTRIIIVAEITEEQAQKLIGQIEKQIEVIKAYYHTDDEIIYAQSALYKIKSNLLFDEPKVQNIIKKNNAQIVTVTQDFFVIEKAGLKDEIDELLKSLKPFGVMQFVRSGRISVSKNEMKISELLKN